MRWPWKHDPDPAAREVLEQSARVAEQSAQSKAALERVDHLLLRAAEVLPDDAMTEIRRTEHAAGHEHG